MNIIKEKKLKIIKKEIKILSRKLNEVFFEKSLQNISLFNYNEDMSEFSELKLNKYLFDEFNDQQYYKIGINLSDFNKIVKKTKNKLGFKKQENYIVIKSDDSEFKIPILDLNERRHIDQNNLEYDDSLFVDYSKLYNMIKKSSLFGNYVIFEIKNKQLICHNKDGLRSYNNKLIKSTLSNRKTKLSIDKLKNVFYYKLKNVDVELLLGDDYPIEINYNNLKFVIAPMMDYN